MLAVGALIAPPPSRISSPAASRPAFLNIMLGMYLGYIRIY
jgi:hypothetical protein